MTDGPRFSRRELIRRIRERGRDRIAAAAAGPARTVPADGPRSPRRSFPLHRPPGAIAEDAFLEACTRCGDCISVCPHDAIVLAPERLRTGAGTPVIEPRTAACAMCADMPCIAACEPRALRAELPVRMAEVRIQPFACLAHQGSFCSVCSERCPVPGAIEVTRGLPRIVEETCTGCGVCQYVCPAPENAILLMPVAERPAVPANGATPEDGTPS